jgi:hypothetical protein
MKIFNDTMGTEPATYRIAAQCLNQMRHGVPPYNLQVFL